MKKITLTIFLLFGINQLFAQQQTPPSGAGGLGLEFIMELKVTTDKGLVLGQTSHGQRRMVPITGGTFEGPNIKGTVLNGGADYQFGNKEKTRTEIEAIYTIKTDDGVLINIRNIGIVIRPKEVAEKIAKGEAFDPNQIYFRAAPKFEAPNDSKYNWLNDALFVSKGISSGGKGYVTIQVWKVL
ncbi:MAG: DUF3237 domain-containing protein [Emticicia sp.]|nr:DUF3237 domain-containing protein [Emticicia sp.]